MNYLNKELNIKDIKNLSQDELNILFRQACISADSKLIKYILSSSKLSQKLSDDFDIRNDWCSLLSKKGDLKIINFILNIQKVFKVEQSIIDNMFLRACGARQIELVKFFLISNKVINKPNIHVKENYAIVLTATVNCLELLKFLLSNFDNMKNIHTQKDELFKTICRNKNQEILDYLIFDCNISITDEIKDFLAETKDIKNTQFKEIVKNKFKMRELELKLNKEMPIMKKTISAKRKL